MQYFKINTSGTSILNPPLYCKSLFVLKKLCLLYIYIAYSIIFVIGEQVIYYNLYKFLLGFKYYP